MTLPALIDKLPEPDENGLVTEMPTVYYEQLFGSLITHNNGNGNGRRIRSVNLADPYIIGFGGARGSGKSESLAYCGMVSLAAGLPVWSNFPIKFRFINREDHERILESRPLYFKDLFAISPDLRGGKIIIDEYQDWDNVLAFATTQTRLLNAFWSQIRKNMLSFIFASKVLDWIGNKTRRETDIEVNCVDSYFTDKSYGKHRKGEVLYWNIMDLSGMWTGKMFQYYPVMHHKRLWARLTWGAFDTNLRFDIFEALRGLKLDLQKSVISDKEEQHAFDINMIEGQIRQIFATTKRIKKWELWETLGIKSAYQQMRIRNVLESLGVREIREATSGRYFEMEDTTSVPAL